MIINHIARIANLLRVSNKDATAYCEEVRRASGLGKQLSDASIARHLLGKKPPFPKSGDLASAIKQQVTSHTGKATNVSRYEAALEGLPIEKQYSIKTGTSALPKHSATAPVTGLVKCPFCNKQVKTKELADHAKQFHAGEHKTPAKTDRKATAPFDHIESTKPVFVRDRTFFVDESGVVINPKFLPRDERPKPLGTRKNCTVPNQVNSGPEHYFLKNKFQNIGGKQARKRMIVNSMSDPVPKAMSWVDRVYTVIERAKKSSEPTLIVCPFCNLAIKPAKLITHLMKTHAEKPEVQSLNHAESKKATQSPLAIRQPTHKNASAQKVDTKIDQVYQAIEKANTSLQTTLVPCPHCMAQVKSTRIEKHLAKVHPKATLHPKGTPKIARTISKQKSKAESQKSIKVGLGWREDQAKALEALRQSFDEPRDGSKGLGHMRREWNGQFGSFPVHDDYSDEANAE